MLIETNEIKTLNVDPDFYIHEPYIKHAHGLSLWVEDTLYRANEAGFDLTHFDVFAMLPHELLPNYHKLVSALTEKSMSLGSFAELSWDDELRRRLVHSTIADELEFPFYVEFLNLNRLLRDLRAELRKLDCHELADSITEKLEFCRNTHYKFSEVITH